MTILNVHDSGPPLLRLALSAMATRFELLLVGDDEWRLRAVGEEVLREIVDCEAAISPFLPGSAIARVNREAHARPVRVDSLTFALLQRCAELTEATDGAFDITVGPLLGALGCRDVEAAAAPRDPWVLVAARAAVGMRHVELDPLAETVRFLRTGMALDLGAVGKGFALDLAAQVLREHHVGAALLHGGTSTVVAIGAPEGQAGFRVAIGAGREPPVATLCDRALSVSSQHRRAVGGPAHVIDPRHGAVVHGDVAAAAVLTASATDADAWSTALLVLGRTARAFTDTTCLIASGTGEAPQWQCVAGSVDDIECIGEALATGSPA